MKINLASIKTNKGTLAFFGIMLFVSFSSIAQKLPNVQQSSFRAPLHVKIDGKTMEWNNQFQAYNHATDIYYIMANDNDNLYLVVQATYPKIIYKIINGGVTFTITTSNKKSSSQVYKITYPVFKSNNLPSIPLGNKPIIAKDSSVRSFQVDSFTNRLNEQLSMKSKVISVNGIKTISDSLISIYNDYGIKTGERFDSKMAYSYELAIPLKLLGLDIDNLKTFDYDIKINGMFSMIPKNAQITEMVLKDESMNAMSDTDFKGQYSLANQNK